MTHESCILGCIVLEPELLDKSLAAGVGTDHFTSPARKLLWRTFVELRAQGKSLDLVQLSMSLPKDCPFEAYSEAEQAAPTSINYQDALESLIWARKQRLLLMASDRLKAALGADDTAGALEQITAIQEIATAQHNKNEADVENAVKEAEEAFQNALDGKPDTRATYPFPLPDMDRLLGPIRDCDLMMVAARTSVGKSSFATQLATANVRKGYKVAMILTEATAKDTVLQIASQVAEVDMLHLGDEFPDKLRKAKETVRKVQACKQLRIFDKSTDLTAIWAICRQVKDWADIIIVDHLAQLSNPGSSRYESLTGVCKAFVAMKKMFPKPIVVCNQLKRLEKNTTPTLNDLKDTGASEEDFSRVVLIHYPDDNFQGIRQNGLDIDPPETRDYFLLQAKHRYGQRDISMRCRYRAKHTLFLPV